MHQDWKLKKNLQGHTLQVQKYGIHQFLSTVYQSSIFNFIVLFCKLFINHPFQKYQCSCAFIDVLAKPTVFRCVLSQIGKNQLFSLVFINCSFRFGKNSLFSLIFTTFVAQIFDFGRKSMKIWFKKMIITIDNRLINNWYSK